MEGGQPFGAHATSKGSVIPRLCKAGWLRIKKNAPVPLKAQTGWLVISRSLLIDAREALLIEWFQSVRCAAIYKEASRFDQPPLLRPSKVASRLLLIWAHSPRLAKAGNEAVCRRLIQFDSAVSDDPHSVSPGLCVSVPGR